MERKILYKIKAGSQLYGTSTLQSDVDYLSVFMPTSEDLLSLQKCEYIDNSTKNSAEDRKNTPDDVDDHMYSLPRFMYLALKGNPTITESLFSPDAEVRDAIISILILNADKLISKRCFHSFSGFAYSQKKKLEYKSMRFGQLERTVEYLETLYPAAIQDSKASMDQGMSSVLNTLLQEYKGSKNNVEHFHEGLPIKVIYEKIKAEYDNYGYRVRTESFKRLNYDVKFGSHMLRLFHEGEELLTKGYLQFPIKGEALDDIMSVRQGAVSLERLYELCDKYKKKVELAYANTNLPKQADWKWANKFLVGTLKEAIRDEEQ